MTSRFYLYPRDGAGVAKIDVPGVLNDFQVERLKLGEAALTAGGQVYTTTRQGLDRVTITIERRSERLASLLDWRDQAHTLVDHIQRGEVFGFVDDTAKAVLYRTQQNAAGLTTLGITSNIFSAWEGAASLSAGDRVVLAGPNPDRLREETRISSFPTASTVTLDRAVQYDHTKHGTLRWWRFYPMLRLDPQARGGPIIISERGLVFSMTIRAVEVVPDIDAVVDGSATLNLGSASTDGVSAGTLDQVAAAGYAAESGDGIVSGETFVVGGFRDAEKAEKVGRKVWSW